MVKDGTCRGGPRMNTGPKRKPLADKITEGKADSALVLPDPVAFAGSDIPEPKDYMLDDQKGGENLHAQEVFRETYLWLKARGCEKLVSRQLLDQYSMDVARWIQCQRAISQFSFLAKHPTTGVAIASPYVAMSREFLLTGIRFIRWSETTAQLDMAARLHMKMTLWKSFCLLKENKWKRKYLLSEVCLTALEVSLSAVC